MNFHSTKKKKRMCKGKKIYKRKSMHIAECLQPNPSTHTDTKKLIIEMRSGVEFHERRSEDKGHLLVVRSLSSMGER